MDVRPRGDWFAPDRLEARSCHSPDGGDVVLLIPRHRLTFCTHKEKAARVALTWHLNPTLRLRFCWGCRLSSLPRMFSPVSHCSCRTV